MSNYPYIEEQNLFHISPTLQGIVGLLETQKYELAIGQLTYLIFEIQNQVQQSIKEAKINQQKTFRKIQDNKTWKKAENIKNPVNNLLSMLFLNRGFLQLCRARISQSISDFQRSLAFNYLNFYSYYHMHVIYLKMYTASVKTDTNSKIQIKLLKQSLDQINCALSCLYLLRSCSKVQSSFSRENDINKAIKYCSNNIDARLKKALFYLNNQEYNKCLRMLNWLIEMGGGDHIPNLISLFRKIQTLRGQNSQKDVFDYSNMSEMIPDDDTYFDFRLISSDKNTQIQIQASTCKKEKILSIIKGKQQQFIKLHQAITKSPHSNIKMGFLKKIDIDFINPKSNKKVDDQNTNIFLLCKNDETNQNIQQKLSPLQEAQKFQEQKKKDNVLVTDNPEDKLQQIIDSIFPAAKSIINEEDLESIQQIQKRSNQINYENRVPKNQQLNGSSHFQQYESYIQSSSASAVLYPIQDEKNLGISIYSLHFQNQELQKKYKNLYCFLKYNNLSLKIKKERNQQDQSDCWNDEFEAPLYDSPQQLVIGVYNKEALAFEDKFIGEARKEISMTGRIKVPFLSDQIIMGAIQLDIVYK